MSLVFLALFLTFSSSVKAADNAGLSEEQETKLILQAQSHLIAFTKELESLSQEKEITDTELEVRMERTAQKILSEYDPKNAHPTLMAKAKKMLKALHWKKIVEWIKHHFSSVVRKGKREGIPVAAALGVSTVMDVTVPIILAQAGLSFLIPASAVIPYPAITMPPAYAIKNLWMDYQLSKLYESREQYNQVKQDYATLYKSLGAKKLTDLFIPVTKPGAQTDVAIVSQSSLMGKINGYFGLGRGKLTYTNLKRFINKEKLNDPFFEAINANQTLPEEVKTLLVLRQIYKTDNPELIARLKKSFAGRIQTASVRPLGAEVVEWLTKFNSTKDLDAAHALLASVPDEIPARVMARFLEQYLIPSLVSRNPEFGAKQITNLQKWAHTLLAKANARPDAKWSQVLTAPPKLTKAKACEKVLGKLSEAPI